MTPKDWTLLVIAAAADTPLQPVHLQKCLFLLGQRLSTAQLRVHEFYTFEPYDYGPFCSAVYSDAEQLREEGLVHIDQPPALSYRLYSSTETGKLNATALIVKLDTDVASYLSRLVAWTTSLSFKQLVAAIYRDFPGMKVNSVFQG
jgi:hypothetical protein